MTTHSINSNRLSRVARPRRGVMDFGDGDLGTLSRVKRAHALGLLTDDDYARAKAWFVRVAQAEHGVRTLQRAIDDGTIDEDDDDARATRTAFLSALSVGDALYGGNSGGEDEASAAARAATDAAAKAKAWGKTTPTPRTTTTDVCSTASWRVEPSGEVGTVKTPRANATPPTSATSVTSPARVHELILGRLNLGGTTSCWERRTANDIVNDGGGDDSDDGDGGGGDGGAAADDRSPSNSNTPSKAWV